MTTAISPPPTSSAARSGNGVQTPTSSRYIVWALGAVVLLAALFMLTKGTPWGGSARATLPVDVHTVAMRSFNITLKEKGELQAARSTDISSAVEGRATIISLVAEGTSVKKGDLLVELASDLIENRIQEDELKESNAITGLESARAELEIQLDKNASDIRKAGLKIELANLELMKYKEGDWANSRRDAEIAIERAEIGLDRATENSEASEKLYERNFITKTEFEEDEFRLKQAQWDLEKAKNQRDVLEKYSHIANLRKLESDLDEARQEADRTTKSAKAEETKKNRNVEGKGKELTLIQDKLAKLRTQREKCRITAPTQGFVIYGAASGGGHFISFDGSGQIKEGATVHERQIIMRLPDTSQMVVVVRVHEGKTNKLVLGQRAMIEVESIPERTFSGTVTKIAAIADTQNRWLNPDLKEYETEITLDKVDVALKPGVTAHVEIFVESIENRIAVPVQAIYSKDGQRYVFRKNKREVEPVPVELGSAGTSWVEITEGLIEDEHILLAFSDDQKRLVPDAPADARSDSGRQGRAMRTGMGARKSSGSHQGRPAGNHGGSLRRMTVKTPGGGSSAAGTKTYQRTDNTSQANHGAGGTKQGSRAGAANHARRDKSNHGS